MKNIICTRCTGKGYISKYNHIEDGLCFKCHGKKELEVKDDVVDMIAEIRKSSRKQREMEEEIKNALNSIEKSEFKFFISHGIDVRERYKRALISLFAIAEIEYVLDNKKGATFDEILMAITENENKWINKEVVEF